MEQKEGDSEPGSGSDEVEPEVARSHDRFKIGEVVYTSWGLATLVEPCDMGWNARWGVDTSTYMVEPYQFSKHR